MKTGTDTIKATTTGSFFPSLSAATFATWDMSLLSDTTPVLFDRRVAATGYDYADSNEYRLFGLTFNGNASASLAGYGLMKYGVNVYDTIYWLGFLTAGATDSLFIPLQNIMYSVPDTSVALPATYNTGWSTSYNYDLNFGLSIALFSYSHAPGIVRSYVTKTNRVVGYGQMRINDIAGLPGMYLDVLQVTTRTIKKDSFFLNAAPMPGTIMATFGVYQGMTDTTYEQRYLRQGEISPLASVTFKDAAYTQPIRARKHVQRLYPYTDGINDAQQSIVNVFPNPVVGGKINIKAARGIYDYVLTDMQGRLMQQGKLDMQRAKGEIELPYSIENGVYRLQVKNVNDVETAISVVISR